MPVSRNEAIVNALSSTTYPVGMCARWTRERFGVAALGDFDGDGDADAYDMWQACAIRHRDDRNPPAGVPLFWAGGSAGHGHAAISLGDGLVRSIDMPRAGVVGTVPLSEIERAWGLRYLGWTEDLYHHEIRDTAAEAIEVQKRIDRKRARRSTLKTQLKRLRETLAALRP